MAECVKKEGKLGEQGLLRDEVHRKHNCIRSDAPMTEQEMRALIRQFTPDERMGFFWMLSTLVQSPASEEFPQGKACSIT